MSELGEASETLFEDDRLNEWFVENHCKMCGGQTCQGIGTTYAMGCRSLEELHIIINKSEQTEGAGDEKIQ